jgi:putative ABC transport system substrate-binding protein
MKRREFIKLVSSVAALWPLVARAQQQPALPLVGFLSSRSPGESAAVVASFTKGLAEAGFAVGQNVDIEYRWAEGQYDRLPALAAELVGMRVAAILAAGGQPPALAASNTTTVVPIVFSGVDDPVALGLVKSLSHPGGNVTGMGLFNSTLDAKRLALLRELVPTADTIAYLTNPSNPTARLNEQGMQEAAKAVSVNMKIFSASNDQEIEDCFDKLSKQHIGAASVAGEPFLDGRRELIVALAAKHRIAASYSWRENVAIGGLLSYGTSITDSYRNAGIYCGRILKGERPADLPVMQPTKFDLTINLKAAKSLGLSVPPAMLAIADEVIE